MTKLLVSVRSAEEAQAALDGGADLIDVKEPHHGSLGMATAQTLHDVADTVAGTRPLSAALGELHDLRDSATMLALQRYDFAKIGLSGCTTNRNWRKDWATALGALPSRVRPVAVVYADGLAHGAPCAEEIVTQAVKFNCHAVLLDTFSKDGRGLFGHCTTTQVASFACNVGDNGMRCVLAGALDFKTIRAAAEAGAAIVAVRSAACRGVRTSAICSELVRELSELVANSYT